MKLAPAIASILALSASCLGTAQSADMKEMDMKGTNNKAHANSSEAAIHKTVAVVKSIDAANGKVKLAHEPVKSLNWPAMTMNFSVRDPVLFDKLAPGKKVEIEFVQQGSASVITAVR